MQGSSIQFSAISRRRDNDVGQWCARGLNLFLHRFKRFLLRKLSLLDRLRICVLITVSIWPGNKEDST